MSTGIDISNHQGRVDWGMLRTRFRLQFAFCKATEGGGKDKYRDAYFSRNWEEIKRQKLTRGAYHFARPKRSSGTDQANFFYSFVQANGGLVKGDWLVLDIEDDADKDNTRLTAWCKQFMETLDDLAPDGVGLMIYTGRMFAGKISALRKWPLWVADYRTPPRPGALAGDVPGWGDKWLIHQYTDAPYDLNYCRLTGAQLFDVAAHGSRPTTPPAKVTAPKVPARPSTPRVAVPDGSPLLRVGSKGQAVRELQRALNVGLNLKTYALKVDGQFGSKTRVAVEKLQKHGKLVVDGVYGPRSSRHLKSLIK